MSGTIIFLLALLPIATVFLLLVVLERSAKFSMLVAYLVTVLTALFVWGTDYTKVLGATVNGVVTAVSLLYIVFGAILGYSAYIWLMRVTTPARATTYAYVNPVVAVLLGWLFAGESLTGRMLIAAAVIIAGVVLITRVSQKPTS